MYDAIGQARGYMMTKVRKVVEMGLALFKIQDKGQFIANLLQNDNFLDEDNAACVCTSPGSRPC